MKQTTPAKIMIIGIGDSGSQALKCIIAEQLKGIDTIAVNTNEKTLAHSQAATRLCIGDSLLQGLGAGGNPVLGKQAAEKSSEALSQTILAVDRLFLVAGLGGGTGTGAIPVIAKIAKNKGIKVIAVVTQPFSFEGQQRLDIAKHGIDQLMRDVDTLHIISLDRLISFVMHNQHPVQSKLFDLASRAVAWRVLAEIC